MIAHKNLLTKKQKEQILSSLQSGGKLVIYRTPKQRGGCFGTLLTSSGVTLLVKALTGSGIQNRQYVVNSRIPHIPLPPKKSGKGMQNRPYSDMFLPYFPTPYWANPTNATGSGIKTQKKESKREKD